jgi:thiol peroxidase
VLLNIFVSLDTPVCAESVTRFNQEANQLPNTVILCVSMDLPFAHERFCNSKGLKNVIPASAFRNPEFGKDYGPTIQEGPLAHLLARAVLVINSKGEIVYTELVPEITHEPNYEAVKRVLQAL